MDKGQLTGAVFIDLTKAFDTVGHSILLSKLCSLGVPNASPALYGGGQNTEFKKNMQILLSLDRH